MRKLGLEGIVGKRIDSVYEPGERSGAWIKLRANMEQEFVIGGYVPGARGFDALLVGVYERKDLIFVAKVKNGFVQRIRDEFFPALKALQTANCPFKNLPEKRSSRWGESITGEKMYGMPMGQNEAGLPGRFCPMDRCRTFEALHFCRHAR